MNSAKKRLLLFLAAAYGAVLLLTSGTMVYAKGKVPGGAMAKAPALRNFGYAQDENTSDNSRIIPYAKNTNLSTGRHYQCLSSDEKILYKAIEDVVTKKLYVPFKKSGNEKEYKAYRYVYYTGNSTFPTRYSTQDEFNRAVNMAQEAVYYDHPDMLEFYMVYATEYGYYKKDGKYQSWLVFVAYEDDTLFASYNSQLRNSLNGMVSQIKARGANTTWNAYNELVAHDYYCGDYDLIYDDSCTSEDDYFDYSHTAYGAIVDGLAVCDGYSAGFSLIMERLGIPSMIVTGEAGEPWNTGGHAWNMVQLDGNWYEVDTTWDDFDGKAIHDFFNKTTADYSLMILGNVHERSLDSGYIGYLLPNARGFHWTYDYITRNKKAYAHDSVLYVNDLQTDETKLISMGDTVSLKVNVLPSNATEKDYVLKSSNSKVVSVSGHKITGVKTGSAVVVVATKDGAVKTECFVSVGLKPGSKFGKTGLGFKVTGKDTVALTGYGKENLTIPDVIVKNGVTYKVTSIADGAFKNNDRIRTVKGGENLSYIGEDAFSGCSELTEVKLPKAKIKKIGRGAFYNCKALSKVELNANKLSKVGKKAFKGVKENIRIYLYASGKTKFGKAVKLIKKAGAGNAGYKRKSN